MKTVIFLFSLILFVSNNLLASEPYALKVKIGYRTDACGTCNHRPMKGVVNLVKKSNKNIILHKFNFSGAYFSYNNLTEFIKIENLHDLMFTYNDPVRGDYHELPFKPNLSSPFDHENKHSKGWISWWATWIRFEVETVDVVKLVDIIDISGKQEPTICTGNSEEEITLNLSVQNTNGPRSLRLLYRKFGNASWGSEYLGSIYKPQFKVKLKDLFYSAIPYGEDIEFKIEANYNHGSHKLESDIITRTFYAQIPIILSN